MNELSSTDFAVLLLSYLKKNNVNKIDVIQLGYALADFYYVNEYRLFFKDYNLRQTIYDDYILDIDNLLMDAYLFGYLDDKKNIVINRDVYSKYSESINNLFNKLSLSLIEKLKTYHSDNTKMFVSDIFYVYKFNFSRKK